MEQSKNHDYQNCTQHAAALSVWKTGDLACTPHAAPLFAFDSRSYNIQAS